MRVGICQINVTVGAIAENAAHILQNMEWAKEVHCDLVVFPEHALCGYPSDDLLLLEDFIEAQKKALEILINASKGISVIVGIVRSTPPIGGGKRLRNSAAVIIDGKLAGFQDKMLLPTYDVFDERRYFEPANEQRVWDIAGNKVAVTICEDIWPFTEQYQQEQYFADPLHYFEKKEIDLLINIAASPYSTPVTSNLSRTKLRKQLVKAISRRLNAPVILCNHIGAQDGLIFDGTSTAAASDGTLLCCLKSFEEDRDVVDLVAGQKSASSHETGVASELFSALTLGLKDYFAKQGFTKACLGLSGGIDSSVVASVAVHALGKDNVLGVLLPSRFTSPESIEDAQALAYKLGIETVELSIEPSLEAVFTTLAPVFHSLPPDKTEENIQARVRGLLLMALCNKKGYLLLNTGNKSEIAMGYFTLYGDSCGAISVIGDLLKRQVYEVGRWINKTWGWIPERVFDKAPTAELAPNQKDSDTLPEYPTLDTIVDECIVQELSSMAIAEKHGFPLDLVVSIVTAIYASEYKRRQLPFALRVSEKAFSCGRKVPIVQRFFG